jgi:GNAT superfamily N-acetyltransferase
LEALGWSALHAEDRHIAVRLPPLLQELRLESCAHSWRQHLPTSGAVDVSVAEALLDDEEAARPTKTFVYVAKRLDGSDEVVAAASISERINGDFPHDGFPVLARCYVRPNYRGRGLYGVILRHRFEYCLQRWGEELRAIHLGSGDASVWWVATRLEAFSPAFLHIGHEDLEVAGTVHDVRDLLAFAPAYVQRLVRQGQSAGSGPAAKEMMSHLRALTTEGLPKAGIVGLRSRVEAAEAESGVELLGDDSPLHRLVALGEAIPVVR